MNSSCISGFRLSKKPNEAAIWPWSLPKRLVDCQLVACEDALCQMDSSAQPSLPCKCAADTGCAEHTMSPML